MTYSPYFWGLRSFKVIDVGTPGEDPESLSHMALNPYRVVTNRQTDRRTDGQTEFP